MPRRGATIKQKGSAEADDEVMAGTGEIERWEDADREPSDKELVDSLHSLINELYTLRVIVEDFKPNSQPVFYEKLNTYIKHLQQIDSLATKTTTTIPAEILNCFDENEKNNPELYTKEKLISCVNETKALDDRIDGLKILRDQLQSGLHQLE